MECKTLFLDAKPDADADTLEGYASVKNEVDAVGDLIRDGAYGNLSDFVRQGFVTVGHDHSANPIGFIEQAREDSHGLFVSMKFHSLRIVKTGGRGIMVTQVPSAASANKWYIASLRVRASIVGNDSGIMAFATAYPAEFHSPWTWSQIDTDGDWGTITMLLKTPVGSTQVDYKLRIEPISWSANTSTGTIEFAEGKNVRCRNNGRRARHRLELARLSQFSGNR